MAVTKVTKKKDIWLRPQRFPHGAAAVPRTGDHSIREQLTPKLRPKYVAPLNIYTVISDDPIRVVTIKIRDATQNQLITSIEILSPVRRTPVFKLSEFWFAEELTKREVNGRIPAGFREIVFGDVAKW